MRSIFGLSSAVSLASATVYFKETFDDTWDKRWVASTWKEGEGSQGSFELNAGEIHLNAEEDKGLYTPEDSKFYGISAEFDSFSNEDKKLIVQYQVKYTKDVECGGGYLKLGPKFDHSQPFGDPTKYNIMFGPDKCGYNKRTHLIFRHGEKNHLKKTDLPYKQDEIGITKLYTLTLNSDNTVRVDVDQEKLYEGKLEEDWDILPAKEIDDPEDTKPEDWVSEPMMEDPSDEKPEDWDSIPKEILDEDDKKSEDWDDDDDGEWKQKMKPNPEYKGEWKPKKIPNPEYKGVWTPKKIPNPDYTDNTELYKFNEFGFVGFDLWQVKAGSIFDNLIITDDVEEAEKMAAKWKELQEVEKEAKKAEAKKAVEAKKKEEETSSKKDSDDDLDVGDDGLDDDEEL